MNASAQILVALSFIILTGIHSASAEAVLDEDGNQLVAGHLYDLVSVKPNHGVFKPGNIANENCSTAIAQERIDFDKGVAVSFHPANSSEGVVSLSSSVNIKFEDSNSSNTNCANSSVWTIGEYSALARHSLVRIGGEEGNPGCSTYLNWFRIEKSSKSSNMTYKVMVDASDVCKKSIRKFVVDLYSVNGTRVLGVSTSYMLQPKLFVTFKKKAVPVQSY